MEKWIEIKGYETLYKVSSYGNIFSIKSNKVLRPSMGTNGYYSIALCKKGYAKSTMIHRIVANHFIANPENKPQVNHINGIKTDNRIENLEWVTQSQNVKHSYDTNKLRGKSSGWRGKFGNNHNRSKAIYEFDLDGNLLNEYESGLDFKRRTGIANSSASWSIKNQRPIYNKLYSFNDKLNFQYTK